jgi:hypothetical protein
MEGTIKRAQTRQAVTQAGLKMVKPLLTHVHGSLNIRYKCLEN